MITFRQSIYSFQGYDPKAELDLYVMIHLRDPRRFHSKGFYNMKTQYSNLPKEQSISKQNQKAHHFSLLRRLLLQVNRHEFSKESLIQC